MKRKVYSLLACLTAAVFLVSCGTPKDTVPQTQPIPAAESTPLPAPAPPAQAASVLLNDGKAPVDAEGFAALRAELDKKLAETQSAAVSLGLSEDYYYQAVMDNTIPLRFEMIIDSQDISLSQRAEIALFQWSELHDFSRRMSGYVGILRALCEGDDMFNMQHDAENLTGDGGWKNGYFFDEFLSPLDKVDSFLVCDEYLEGYGMDDALLCSFGKDGMTLEQANEYIDELKARGLYTYSENHSDTQAAWYGCWVGDDGKNCYVYVERSPNGEGALCSS